MNFDHGYIVTEYREGQDGQPIKECQVVRADNGRFYRADEPTSFSILSRARCPTYGNCNSCYRSGPLNMCCRFCNDATKGYAIMFVYHPVLHCKRRIVDAEYFAHLTKLTDDHVVALADRHWTWIRDNDHGEPTRQFLSMLVPPCNQDGLRHLLDNPDTV